MRRVSAARKAEEGCGRTGMVVEAAQLQERRRQSRRREKVESFLRQEKWKESMAEFSWLLMESNDCGCENINGEDELMAAGLN